MLKRGGNVANDIEELLDLNAQQLPPSTLLRATNNMVSRTNKKNNVCTDE